MLWLDLNKVIWIDFDEANVFYSPNMKVFNFGEDVARIFY